MSDQLSLFGPDEPIPTGLDSDVQMQTDLDARAFAEDPEHNVVLEASAGTGKTSVLVARYLNLLRRGVDPVNILAITFTRKAAAEMRERIVGDLRRAAAQSTLDRSRWLSLRDRLADIQIGTIDAFCLAMLREFPLEADLDPDFALADETEVPRFVDQALDKSLAIFIGLAKREPDIALVLAQLGLARTREGLAHLLGRRLVARDALDRFLARCPPHLESADVCRSAVDRLAGLFHAIPGGVERFLDDGPTRHLRYQLLARDLRRLDEFYTADNAAVRGLIDRVSAHFLTASGKRRASEKIYPYVNDDYPDAAAGKRHRAAALASSEPVANIVRAFARDLNGVLARGVRRMFSIALAQYRIALDERSLLDFSDVLQRAVDLLSRMDEFSQSRFRLEGRYHHVLVDEFQDTSRKQWELVSLLVRAWGEGLGIAGQPSIFIVGDRKQSIYRFRDADVSVLADAGVFVDGLRPGGSARRSITRSFRAVSDLLAFVNDLFAEIASAPVRADDFRYGEGDRFPVEPASSRRSGPALGIAAAEDPLVCAKLVAKEVERILKEDSVRDKQSGLARRVRPGDIAILFRSRTSHREFEQELESLAIPAYVYKGLGFFDADEIKDVSALIRFLANPSSDLRAAAFLRSRFIRISDEALARLAPRLAAALTDPDVSHRLDPLVADDRRALEHARVHVPEWIAQVDRVPPADLIERILPETAYAHELRGPRAAQAWENLKKMRGLIRRIQNRGYATLARIADHLDSLTAGDESNAVLEALDAVNLMTIHAAKGLEFPVVFVVNLARGASGPPKPVRVAGDDVAVGPFVSESDEEERAREREETKRLLYVALTRARDRLYLASVLKNGLLAPGRGSLAEVLPESVRGLFSRAATAFDGVETLAWSSDSGRVFEFRRCTEGAGNIEPQGDALSGSPSESLSESGCETIATGSSIVRESVTSRFGKAAGITCESVGDPGDALSGTLLHRLFHGPNGLTDESSLDEVAEVARRRLHPDEIAVADVALVTRRAAEAWQSVRRRPEVNRLFHGTERRHEVPFSLRLPDQPDRIVRGSIDCLVRGSDGTVTVVEFKTGRPRPDHEAQLSVYVQAARQLFPGARVEGLLVYKDEQ
ncbi:MAG TPA: UvrD-helicase domain-containing protein [Vicinamibacterales bacterium]